MEQTYAERQSPQTIISNYSIMALVVGMFPLPLVVGMSVKALQLKMVYELCQTYQIKFSENLFKSVLLILAAGIAASGFVKVFSMLVPTTTTHGWLTNMSVLAMGAGAETYAIGYIMHKHFAAGGTLADFNLQKSRQHLADLYAEGKSHKIFSKNASSDAKPDTPLNA